MLYLNVNTVPSHSAQEVTASPQITLLIHYIVIQTSSSPIISNVNSNIVLVFSFVL